MVGDIIPHRKPVPDAIVQKAVDHAKARQKEGKPVFWSNETDGSGAPALSNDQKIKLQILNNAKISQQRRLEDGAKERMSRGDARIQEKIVRSRDPLYQPPLDDFINDYGDPVIGKAMYDRYAIELEEIKKKNLPPKKIAPEDFAKAADMAMHPDNYTYIERMAMAYNLNNMKADDPGVVSLISQINSTFHEAAKVPFLSPETRKKNGDYLRIFDDFSKANSKGWGSVFEQDEITMKDSGTVTSSGESSWELGKWLSMYDLAVATAEREKLSPIATEKLLDEYVFSKLRLLRDTKMTRENSTYYVKTGMSRLEERYLGVTPEAEDSSKEDEAWVEAEIEKANRGSR